MLSLALFYEKRRDGIQASYTTKDYDKVVDGITYLSLRKIYISCLDPTEEEFVQKAFDGNWGQWRKLKGNNPMKTLMRREGLQGVVWYDEWASVVETKLRSLGIQSIVHLVTTEEPTAQTFAAAKWLASGEWKSKRGRPTKSQIESETKVLAKVDKENADDIKRMSEHEKRLKVIK